MSGAFPDRLTLMGGRQTVAAPFYAATAPRSSPACRVCVGAARHLLTARPTELTLLPGDRRSDKRNARWTGPDRGTGWGHQTSSTRARALKALDI